MQLPILAFFSVFTEPPLDQHMLVFTGKCSPCTGKKNSRRYHIPAENEHFVRLAGETLPWVQKQVAEAPANYKLKSPAWTAA